MLDEKIPQQIEGIDMRHLNIGPKDGFVYSQIDGVLNVQDLADLMGVASDELQETVDRLVGVGLVRWLTSDAIEATKKYGVAELNEEIDLHVDVRRRILEKHSALVEATHYELLGVSATAAHADIRKAYFKLSKEFHPDSHYGKNLGSFQSKMEAIFKRLTDAYEVLSRESKREKYDRYLEKRNAAMRVERQLARGAARAKAMERAMTQPPREAAPGAPVPQVPGPDRVPAVTRPPGQPMGSPAVTKPPAQPAVTERPAVPFQPLNVTMPAPPLAPRDKTARERVKREPVRKQDSESDRIRRKRELLARKLGGRSFKPLDKKGKKPTPTPTDTVAAEPKIGARAALRGLTASLKQTAAFTGGVDRVQRHVESARIAELEGDLASAATALRMAMAVDPTYPALQDEYHRVSQSLQTELHDIHVEQARYEEENRLWSAAAISWAKVADGDPSDPIAPRSAGLALLKAGGDLRKARDFAQKSVELEPDSAHGRAVLAQVYLGAGMENSARKELEAAAKLDPDHEMVKNLLKKL